MYVRAKRYSQLTPNCVALLTVLPPGSRLQQNPSMRQLVDDDVDDGKDDSDESDESKDSGERGSSDDDDNFESVDRDWDKSDAEDEDYGYFEAKEKRKVRVRRQAESEPVQRVYGSDDEVASSDEEPLIKELCKCIIFARNLPKAISIDEVQVPILPAAHSFVELHPCCMQNLYLLECNHHRQLVYHLCCTALEVSSEIDHFIFHA